MIGGVLLTIGAIASKSDIGNRQSEMNKGLHRYILLLTGATFLLLVAGALVTSHDAGLATPDWPLSNGQVFPKMVGNLFWEHGHRLVATTVGMLTVALNFYLYAADSWLAGIIRKISNVFVARGATLEARVTTLAGIRDKREPRLWVRRLGLVALCGVIAQGLLGGLTVKLMLPLWVSAAHATLAQLFFCTVVSLAVFTSAVWHNAHETQEEKGAVPLRYLCVAAAVTIFLQLILGATLRHSAPWDRQLPTELLLAHIGGALAVTIVLGTVAFNTLRRHGSEKYLTRPVGIALALLGVQLLLGVAAYLTRLGSPNDPQPLNPMIGITVAHVACGALVFGTTMVLTLRSFRLLRANRPAVEFVTAT